MKFKIATTRLFRINISHNQKLGESFLQVTLLAIIIIIIMT